MSVNWMKRENRTDPQIPRGISGFNMLKGGPGSVVGIATAYGLDGPGIESR